MAGGPGHRHRQLLPAPGHLGDLIATKYGFTRDDADAYAVESQKRAAKAWDEGRFAKSVVPVKDINGLTILALDEHMRPQTDMQSLGQLKARFVQMGERGGFDAVAIAAHPRRGGDQPRPPRRQLVRHRRRRRAVLLGSSRAAPSRREAPGQIRAFASIGSEIALMLTGPVT
jgi:acetyl-CoA C-acetyltransferase